MRTVGWTPLPPLELRGLDVGLAESLDHYALRVADACDVPINKLASMLRVHAGYQATSHAAQYLSSWTGPRSDYAVLLNALSELTGQANLFKGTFHCVSNVLGRGGLSTRARRIARRRWCPRCYLEWEADRSYEPLIWAFSALSACPEHGVPLEGNCHACGIDQPIGRSYGCRRDCVGCKGPLGHAGIQSDLDETQAWVDGTLKRFAGFLVELDEPLTLDGYDKFIRGLADRQCAGEAFPPAVRAFINDRKTCIRYRRSLPTISQYLNLCAFQACDISTILTCPEEAASANLLDRSNGFTRVQFKRRVLAGNLRELMSCMEGLLRLGDIYLPPVSVLYREFGLWGDVVQDSFADTHRRYLDRLEAQPRGYSEQQIARAFSGALHLARSEPSHLDKEEDGAALAVAMARVARLPEELCRRAARTIAALHRIRLEADPEAENRQRASAWKDYVSGFGTG